MKNATDTTDDNERSGHCLDVRLADFIQRWKPTGDDRDAFNFQVQLNELIRSAYAEAAKPYHKQMAVMLQYMSTASGFMPTPKEGKAS